MLQFFRQMVLYCEIHHVPVGQIVCNGLHELALILDIFLAEDMKNLPENMQNIMLTFQINSLSPTLGYMEYSLCRNRK